MPKFIDLTGKSFGKLTVISQTDRTPSGRTRWLCQCTCGGVAKIHGQRLTSGQATNCGCDTYSRRSAACRSHGHTINRTISPTYHTWAGMVARCSNPNHIGFHKYGGAGITVCDKWLTFAGFLEEMGEKPEGFSLDRIDNSLGYFKENCRWADDKTQARNKTNSRIIKYNGEAKTLADWSESTGITYAVILARLDRLGWSIGEALGFVKREIIRHPIDPSTGRFVSLAK